MNSRMTRLVFYPLNWYQLLEEIEDDDNKNKLVVLDNRQLSVLHSLVNLILPYYWIWGVEKTDSEGRTAISDFKEKLEADLMAVLNIDDLIKTNLMLVAALTGETIDRDHPENYMAGSYTPTGLTPTVELTNTALGTLDTTVSGALTTHNETFNSMLEQIELIQASLATMAGKSPDDLADDLEGIASTISTIATILGVVA